MKWPFAGNVPYVHGCSSSATRAGWKVGGCDFVVKHSWAGRCGERYGMEKDFVSSNFTVINCVLCVLAAEVSAHEAAVSVIAVGKCW